MHTSQKATLPLRPAAPCPGRSHRSSVKGRRCSRLRYLEVFSCSRIFPSELSSVRSLVVDRCSFMLGELSLLVVVTWVSVRPSARFLDSVSTAFSRVIVSDSPVFFVFKRAERGAEAAMSSGRLSTNEPWPGVRPRSCCIGVARVRSFYLVGFGGVATRWRFSSQSRSRSSARATAREARSAARSSATNMSASMCST